MTNLNGFIVLHAPRRQVPFSAAGRLRLLYHQHFVMVVQQDSTDNVCHSVANPRHEPIHRFVCNIGTAHTFGDKSFAAIS